jgi:hypothetical protein
VGGAEEGKTIIEEGKTIIEATTYPFFKILLVFERFSLIGS